MRQDQKETKDRLGRRQFFRALGGGTVAAAVGVAATPMTATDAEAYDPGQDETKGRYRLTDHVKAFYRTNGYETLQNNTNAAGKK